MPKFKNQTLYWATFRDLRLHAWGKDQVCRETFIVTVYQVSCRPEKWAARPQLSQHVHKWEGSTAAAVMQMVAADFEVVVQDWQPKPAEIPPGRSLRSGSDVGRDRRQA